MPQTDRLEMQPRPTVQLSVISPVYGCTTCLGELCRRIAASVETLGISYEIILVDDRGPDQAWPDIMKLVHESPGHLRAIRLSRNFGQQMAITAGLAQCRGQAAVVLDCDLQDPPEEIPRLYAKHLEGYAIVLTRRKAKKHSFFKRATSILYTKIIQFITNTRVESEVGGFSLISRPVIDAFLQFKEINRHYLPVLHWLGFDLAYLDYAHQPRATGESGYTLKKLLQHALSGLLFYKSRIMNMIIATGLLLVFLGFSITIIIIASLFYGHPAPQWSATVIGFCLVGGLIILTQGLVGLYVEETFEQTKARPLYIISDSIGMEVEAQGIPTNHRP